MQPRQRHPQGGGQLTGDRLDSHHHFRGENRATAGAGMLLQAGQPIVVDTLVAEVPAGSLQTPTLRRAVGVLRSVRKPCGTLCSQGRLTARSICV